MKLFKKREEPADPQAALTAPVKPGGKGRATPKRKEAEARRLHPVVPADRKAARREARALRDEAWQRQRQAMITGDERYLPARDKGPIKRYIRDYVDARYSVGELFLPLSILLIVIVFGFSSASSGRTTASFFLMLGLYGVFFLAIGDAIMCWWFVRRRLILTFGREEVRGAGTIFWYVFSRCFNLRRWRQPAPQVGRREFPERPPRPGT